MTTTTNKQQEPQLCQAPLSPRPLSLISTRPSCIAKSPEGSSLERPGLRVCHLLHNSQISSLAYPP